VEPPIYIQIEENPNCASMAGQVFQPKTPPRQVKRVRMFRNGRPIWCDVVALDEGGRIGPAIASLIDDSGDGNCYLITGGTWGLKLSSEADAFGEPYLLLSGDGKDIEFA